MEKKSLNYIATDALGVLRSPDLEEITEVGKRFVEMIITFARTIDK